jgi:protein-disulfide isomerase
MTERIQHARVVAAISAVIGLAASAALLAPYIVRRGFCGAGGGCDKVAHSAYSAVLGVPRPVIGVIAFAALLTLIIAKGAFARRAALLAGVVFLLEGVHLLALQAFVLHAWCPFCVVIDVSSIVAGIAIAIDFRHQERDWLKPAWFGPAALVAFLAPLLLSLTQKPVVRGEPIAALPKQEGKLVLREFVDLECPYCRMTHVALKKVLKDRPDVIIERRHVPLPMHEHAEVAAVAACCAGEQQKEEPFVDAVMTSDAEPNAKHCRDVAVSLGIDIPKWEACFTSGRAKKRIDEDVALANATKVPGLPTIDLDGERHVGALDEASAKAFLARHH